MRRSSCFAAVLLLLVAVLPACSEPASGNGTIKVGFLYPFQGDNAIWGEWAEAGINLRLEQPNATVNGRKIEIVKANEDATDPSATLLSLKTLVEKDGVQVVIGPAFSSSQEAVAAYAKQANITLLTLLTCPWDLAANKHLLCWPGTDVATTRALGAYAHDVLGYRRIDTIGPDYVAGHNYIGGAADEFERKGGSINQQQWVPLTATDMGPYVSKVDPDADALLMWLLPSNLVAFVQQYRASGLRVPILLLFDAQDPFNEQLGPLLEGTVGTNFWEPSVDSATSKQFVSAFTKAYPDLGNPNITQMGGWTMTDALIRVLRGNGADTSYDKLHPAFLELRWDTPEGPACFTVNNMVLTNQYITQMASDGGKYHWKILKEYPYQSDPRDTGKCA